MLRSVAEDCGEYSCGDYGVFSRIVAEHSGGVSYDSGHGFEQRDFTNSPMSEYGPIGETAVYTTFSIRYDTIDYIYVRPTADEQPA